VVRIAAPLGDYFAVGTNTCNAAQALGTAGEVARARAMIDPIVRSLASAPEADVVGFMVSQGLLHLWDGDAEGAVGWFQRGVQRMTDQTRDWTAARCLPGLVGALRRLGRTEEAREWAARAVGIETAFGAPYELTGVIDEQARLLWDADLDQARELHLEALTIRRAVGLRTGYVDSLDAIAGLEARVGNHQEAVRLLATSDAGRVEIGYPRPPVDLPEHEALVASLRASLGQEAFEDLWREGEGRPLDDAVAVLTRGRGPRNRPQAGWASLTPTELDVARLVSQGLSNPEIASRLYVSRSTVKAHLAHIYAKVGLANRTELATLASRELAEE
jgi:DNA-binding CsgD family transcriptional regulator